MTQNEIKKLLYKQKPIAIRLRIDRSKPIPEGLKDRDVFQTVVTAVPGSMGYIINFEIPFSEQPEGGFPDEEQAQLLIRWLVTDKA